MKPNGLDLIVGSVNTNNLDFLNQRLIFKELKPI
jgi:hypothetical protein